MRGVESAAAVVVVVVVVVVAAAVECVTTTTHLRTRPTLQTRTTARDDLPALRLRRLVAPQWREMVAGLLVLALALRVPGAVMGAAVVALEGGGTLRRRQV